ncbi:MAG: DUF2865 domain-containing protein, partial [Xanthobacteraceae bacterium]
MTQRFRILTLASGGAVAFSLLWAAAAHAQQQFGQQQAPPVQGQVQQQAPQSSQSPVCARLETQLASVERGGGDPSRSAAIQRNQDAVNRAQTSLDQLNTQSNRLGCRSAGIFSIFTPQPPQCSSLSSQIDQARSALDRAMSDMQRSQSGGGNDLESQRQSVIAALAQNNCGAQYRAAAAAPQRGVFETIFGGANTNYNGIDVSQGGSFRTLCVRSCDGFYYPISFATSPAHFAEDEQTCRNTCPAAEVTLFSHRTNEDVRAAATIQGRRYTDLPNAFKYRQTFDPSCSCRRPGQSWADALGQSPDRTVVRGDIIVTDDKAKAMSQPLPPGAAGPRPAQPATAAVPAGPPPAAVVTDPSRPVRQNAPPSMLTP